MSFTIHSLATAVPPAAFPQQTTLEAAKILSQPTEEQARALTRIFSLTGIDTRHMVLGWPLVHDILAGTRHSQSVFLPSEQPQEQERSTDRGPSTGQRMKEYVRHAGALAVQTARQALHQSGVLPRQITHLVTVSCTGFHAPGVDIELIQGLNLPATTQRTHVGFMGCHGAINGLRVANGLAGTHADVRVLLCAVELCSLHCVYEWDLEKMVASALFSDGVAALVGSSAGPAALWRLAASGSCVFPHSTDAMSWTVGDHGFEMTLSKKVPGLIARHLPGWINTWLGEQGLRLQDVGSWCIHPGGPKILDAVVEVLGIGSGATKVSREILAEFGNMSSGTILFILERLMQQRAARPCVALAFGPGLTAEAALFR